MPYGRMYALLFNKITDMIEELQEAQRQAEEFYIKSTPEGEDGPVSEKDETASIKFLPGKNGL